MVNITNLHKKFGPLVVLNGLNLKTPESGIIAVLGPNGSGKTTLIKSILGMVVPQKGEIQISPVVNIAVKSIHKVTKLKEIIANKRSSDLLVTQIFLVSTIRNVKKTVWKT